MKKKGKNTVELIHCVMSDLEGREQRILRFRFGMDDGYPRTLLGIGEELNLTSERIRQIEAKALRKLRHPSRSGRLRVLLWSMEELDESSQLFLKAIFGPSWQKYIPG